MDFRRGSIRIRRSTNKSTLHNFGSKLIELETKRWKILLKKLVEHWSFSALMTILTIYALFGDDLRLLATTKQSDEIFYSISTICLFLFSLEIILASLVKESYFFSFFFWLDLIATVSLITDIGWIWDSFLEQVEEDGASGNADAADASEIARAARASRLGTRAGRIIRILRVIRLIRIVKLYKLSEEAKLKSYQHRDLQKTEIVYRGYEDPLEVWVEREEFSMFSIEGSLSDSFSEMNSVPVTKKESIEEKIFDFEADEEAEIPQESKVGKKLSEMTTRRIIILVLGMMFGLPLFMNSFFIDENTSYEYGLEVLDAFVEDLKNFEIAWNYYVDEHKDLYTPLVFLEVENTGFKYESGTDPDDLRNSEKLFITLEDLEDDYKFASLAIFDLRKDTQLEAGLNMLKTVFVCIVLSISSILISHDAENIIVGPIENMIKKVKKIAKNPLQAAKDEEREEYTKQLIIQENPEFSDKQKENLETAILEKTLTKIGALLAIGFGEAGSEIIAANIQSGGGDVDPMIPGKRQICIFGFCDIRNFTDTTEILQETVMQFVNKIAKVVHRVVDEFSGNANKNIGDAFLLVWKFPPQAVIKTPESIRLTDDPVVSVLADMSVVSFIKIIALIATDPYISVYNSHTELERNFPGYKVKMGFGLHQGWAIEGAIGSEYKIDASYLSPNVNMASRLEAATKQFGVPLLISEDLYEVCSLETEKELRCIDRVTVKGSIEPVSLYTCDLDTSLLRPKPFEESEHSNLKISKILASIERDELLREAVKASVYISDYFEDDSDIKLMRGGLEKFEKEFEYGLEAYLKGNWSEAASEFVLAQNMKGVEDGPVQTLLEFMESYGNEAPEDWPGYRELHDK